MIERIREWALGIALFAVMFLVGVYFTFPMAVVARMIEAQAEKAMEYRYDLEIGRARFAGLNGISLLDVTITSTGELPPNEPRMSTELDRVSVRVRLFDLLRGQQGATVDVLVGDGRLWASGSMTDTGLSVDLRLDEFPLDRVTLMREALGMGPVGTLSGAVQLTYDDEFRLTDGTVLLNSPSLVFGAGIPKISALERSGAFIRLPATELGVVTIDATITESNVTLNTVSAVGADVEMELSGTVQLRDPVRASRVSMQLRLGLNSTYVEEASLGPVLAEVPLLQQSLTPSGYAIALTGNLGSLRPTPL